MTVHAPWIPRYETSRHLWLVLEYCVGGSLASLLQQDGSLPEESIHDLARDLVVGLQVSFLPTCRSQATIASVSMHPMQGQAMQRLCACSAQCMHSAGMVYCDLKPSNVLMDENGMVKLGGFGLSRKLAACPQTDAGLHVSLLPPHRD